MKYLFDYLPIIAFFIAYYIPEDLSERMYIATGAAIVAAVVQVCIMWLIYRRVEKMHLISLGVILILGGSTLITEDKRFFMWKPTVVCWIFSLVLIGSEIISKKTLVQRIMGGIADVPRQIWVNINRSWALFFLFMGGLNLYVAFYFTEPTWVNFKLFGAFGLTLVFALAQALYLAKILPDSDIKKQ